MGANYVVGEIYAAPTDGREHESVEQQGLRCLDCQLGSSACSITRTVEIEMSRPFSLVKAVSISFSLGAEILALVVLWLAETKQKRLSMPAVKCAKQFAL